MASTHSISTALKSCEPKKENLRKAFEDLQSHSSLLSSFTLQWKDLEEHFDSIQKSIEERFNELKSKESLNEPSTPPPPSSSSTLVKQPSSSVKKNTLDENSKTVARPELKSFCSKMDAMGLRLYIMNHRNELPVIRDEVGDALKSASDPAKLVLDTMCGFYPPYSKGDKDGELAAIRRTCILLLERLKDISPNVDNKVKEGALNLAFEWKGKIIPGGQNPLEALAFLQLLATYGVASAFNADELLAIALSVARRKQAIDLCRSLGFNDKIPDLIQKLSDNGQQLDAVKFAYAFELVDKFPPVPLLKDYLKHSKKVAQDIRKKGNHSAQSQNEATAKELAAVRAIIKNIEEHNLESEYPREGLDKRVEQLEKQKADRKRPTKFSTEQHQNPGNKRPRPTSSLTLPNINGIYGSTSTVAHSQPQVSYHPGSLLPDRELQYLSASAAQYGGIPGSAHGGIPSSAHGGFPGSAHGGFPGSAHGGIPGSAHGGIPGSAHSIPPQYMSAAVSDNYVGGLGAASSVNYGVQKQPSPSRSNLYSFEQHVSASLYERATGYGSHGLPPPTNRPSYYP